jgi:ABC-type transport system involved in multi-copper enzyme maturation permease subunit
MLTICNNTIKEFIRNKILYIILITSILLVFLTIALSQLAMSEQKKIILDFSLTIIEVFGLISTLFLWSYLLKNEISNSTILLILSKRPSKKDFILGKFFWFSTILLFIYFILSLAVISVLWIHNIPFEAVYLWAIFLSYIKIIIVLTFIIFFSTFVWPFVALLSSLVIYIISHMLVFLKFFVEYLKRDKSESNISENIVNILYYIFPNFHDLSMKEFLLSPHLWAYTIEHILLSTLVNVIYIAILLYFAIIIFNKKEF